MARSPYDKQISNRNFLSATSFKFSIAKCPKVDFLSNQCNVPGMNLSLATQPTYLRQIDLPGDELSFDDFTLDFMVDENLELHGNTKVDERFRISRKYSEAKDLDSGKTKFEDKDQKSNDHKVSDGTLSILNSSQNPKFLVKFKGLFPVSLTGLDFDATAGDTAYFTSTVTFKYLHYDIVDVNGQPLYES